MPPESGLALFQHKFMQLLWEVQDAEEIRATLLADAALSEFHGYIKGMDRRMIEVASELVHKWGRS